MTINRLWRRRQIIWKNILFFGTTAIFTLIGLPIYIYHNGLALSEVLLFSFYVVATGLSITVGYHRLFSHRAFEAHKLIQFFILFFGAAAFEESALHWSSQHRDHHRYVDTERDPYSIKRGFFYAHIGWLLFWNHRVNYRNVSDLRENPLVVSQYRYYSLWAIGSGIAVPLVVGMLTGHLLGAFLLSVCARITLVSHSTFCINSVCHMFGKATYDPTSSARDHWFVALLTNGEGYHNFHHRFPSDYRNGIRWYHWDPSKWMILLLAALGFAERLNISPEDKIQKAKIWAQTQRRVALAK